MDAQPKTNDLHLSRVINMAAIQAKNYNAIIIAFGTLRDYFNVVKCIEKIERKNGPMVEEDFIRKDELFTPQPGARPEYTAIRFTNWMEKWDSKGRPALPAAAIGWMDVIGVRESKNKEQQNLNHALILSATRAEMVRGKPVADDKHCKNEPAYHARTHYLHVLQATGHLIVQNDMLCAENDPDAVELNDHDKTLMLIAAAIHDIDHPGRDNEKASCGKLTILYQNEDASFDIADWIFKGCDLTDKDRNIIHLMVRTTDPNGPHAFLKRAMDMHRAGKKMTPEQLMPGSGDRYKDLYPLLQDKKLCTMCAMLSDADLFASAGAGLKANEINSRKFTKEKRAAGEKTCDFTTPGARMFFFNNIVGEHGFASPAGRAAFNETFEQMRAITKREIAAAEQSKPAASTGTAGPQ